LRISPRRALVPAFCYNYSMDYKFNGIVIKKYDLGEADRSYVIYTKESGKIRAISKGVKKHNSKLAGNLEPITQSEIFLSRNKGQGNITGVIAQSYFEGIRNSFEKTQQVFFCFEIFNRLIDFQVPDEKSYRLLSDFLNSMEKAENEEDYIQLISLGFMLKLLDSLGYRIEAEKCVKCLGKLGPKINYFSGEYGGTLCTGCVKPETRKISITPNAIKLIRIILKNNIGNLTKLKTGKADINSLKQAINHEISWIAD